MEKNKKTVMAAVVAFLLFAAGIIVLLDSLGVAFSGVTESWYVLLFAFLAAVFMAYAVVAKAPVYVLFATAFGGVFVMLLIPLTTAGVTYYHTWGIIPMFLGLGLIAVHFLSGKRLGYLKTGIYLTVVSAVFIVASATDGWKFALPAVLLMTAAFIAAVVAIRQKKAKKTQENGVIYVTPTEENHDEP